MQNENNIIGKSIAVFDLEIKNTIDQKTIGWKDYDKMGISVGCVYSFRDSKYAVFMDDNLEDMVYYLNSHTMITGFNIEGFDIPLIEGSTDVKLKPRLIYDMLKYSKLGVQNSGRKVSNGLKLDEHLKGTLGIEKSGDGANAPILYQEKQIGRLVSYCIHDVQVERALFEHIWYNNKVVTAKYGETMLSSPIEIYNSYTNR